MMTTFSQDPEQFMEVKNSELVRKASKSLSKLVQKSVQLKGSGDSQASMYPKIGAFKSYHEQDGQGRQDQDDYGQESELHHA